MEVNRNHQHLVSIRDFIMVDGTIIGVFKGTRGANPDHDIKIMYKEPGKNIRTPAHIHWVIDLLVKKEHNRTLTLEFMRYLRGMYDLVDAFHNVEERNRCGLEVTSAENLRRFAGLNNYGEYKVDFISSLIELMIKMEKNMPPENPARVFKQLMETMIQEKDIFEIVSKAIQKRR